MPDRLDYNGTDAHSAAQKSKATSEELTPGKFSMFQARKKIEQRLVELRQVDEGLAALENSLAEARQMASTELGHALSCVRCELLHDAIATLEAAVQRSDMEHSRFYFERKTRRNKALPRLDPQGAVASQRDVAAARKKQLDPLEPLEQEDLRGLSDAELLGSILGSRIGGGATKMVDQVLMDHSGLAGLLRCDVSQLLELGLARSQGIAIMAAAELATRMARAEMPRRRVCSNPALVARYLSLRYLVPEQEILGALYLDVKNRLIGENEIYRGTLARVAVEPRVILRLGLQRKACGFILFHTHPSGDPEPSPEDIAFTRRMITASEIMGIRLVDHLILGDPGAWASLRQLGVFSGRE